MSEYRFLKKLKRIKRRKEIEPQEIFLDKLAAKKEQDVGLSERKIEVPLSRKIILGIFFFFILFILVIFSKTFQLQVLEKNKYIAKAEENKFIIGSLKAERGVIYDSQGKQLVFNNASFDLVLKKDELSNPEDLNQIAKIINKDLEELKNKINNKDITVLAENLDHQTLILLQTKISGFEGFYVLKNSTRFYQDSSTFSHLIGYISKIGRDELKASPEIYSNNDYTGKEGLEKYYEEVLRTHIGKIQIERDVYGNLLEKEVISLPESGDSLVLWLDSDLQKKAEEEVKKTLERVGAKKAIVVAIDPRNGGVLSLVSVPSYDNNLFNNKEAQEELEKVFNDPDNPLFNRVISGLYPTGSTIKPLIATGALMENIISPNKKLYCEGKISITNKYDPEIVYVYHDNAIHGPTDMRKAIAESCNVYFFTIGGGYGNQKGLGPTKIKKYLNLFGWGQKTNIDLLGESLGFIPSPEWKKETKNKPWVDGDTYNLSIGQGGILITPLQVATAFTAVANGGTLYKPQVVKEIVDNNKNVVQEFQAEIVRENFVNKDYLEVAREGMRKAVTGEGAPKASSVTLNSLPVEVAAKTGTAETPYKDTYHNWVTVFAPYDNPEIVLTIMIENVPGVQAAALPTAKNILEWYFTK